MHACRVSPVELGDERGAHQVSQPSGQAGVPGQLHAGSGVSSGHQRLDAPLDDVTGERRHGPRVEQPLGSPTGRPWLVR
jgi:hypothetical protein